MLKKRVRSWALLSAGAVVSAFCICCFVRTAGLFPGGFTGISLLIQELCTRFLGFTPPYSVLSLSLNFVAASLCFKFIGKRFAVLSLVAVAITSVLTDVLPTITLAEDPLLNSVFGGLISGFGTTLCLSAGASTGGTDFISIYLAEKKNRDAFHFILAGNVVMLTVAGAVLGWERALYSMIYQYCATQALHAMYRRYQHRTMWIVTNVPDQIYPIVRDSTHHGATLFQGTGLYQNEPRSMIYTVVSGDDVRLLIHKIKKVDPRAFINTQRTDSLQGRFYHKPQE